MLMLALLLLPMVEKVTHELGHLDDDNCSVEETHFCPKEHICKLCDYIFSSSSSFIPPNLQNPLCVINKINQEFFILGMSSATTAPKFQLSLRGPPVC